jgi:hypothetical protein
MAKKFWKKCGCGGDPTCYTCKGTDRVEDREAELEYADYCHDRDKDDRLERKHERDD